MTLGEKITDLRKKRGLSQEELAITLGVSRQAVSKWETTEAKPDTDKIVALAEFFEVTTDWLLRDIEPQESPAGSAQDGIPSVQSMLRGAPMLFNLTMGGNILGAALMVYDLWQQTYYHIPTLLGLIVQIGMCALFLGLCHSIRAQDDTAGRAWARAYWRCNIFALALLPSFGRRRQRCTCSRNSRLYPPFLFCRSPRCSICSRACVCALPPSKIR